MVKTYFSKTFEKTMKSSGWVKIDAGSTKAIDYNNSRIVFVKKIPVAEIIKNSASYESKEEKNSSLLETDTKDSRDIEKYDGVYNSVSELLSSSCLPPSKPIRNICYTNISDRTDNNNNVYYYQCVNSSSILNDMRSSVDSLIIRADSIWVDNPSLVLSYNFSICLNDCTYTFLFFPFSDVTESLSVNYMLGRIFDYLGIKRYDRRSCIYYEYIDELNTDGEPVVKATKKYNEALTKSIYAFVANKPTANKYDDIDETLSKKRIRKAVNYKDLSCNKVTLLLYHGLRFFSSTDIEIPGCYRFISSPSLKENDGGIFNIKPNYFTCCSSVDSGWNYLYAVELDVRDVVSHSVFDGYGVWKFADAIGYDTTKYKGKIEKQFERQLIKLFFENPIKYAEYAVDRNLIVLLYMFRIWGQNKKIPCTLLSGLDERVMEKLSNYFGCDGKKEFFAKYSGTTQYRSSAKDFINKKYGRKGKYIPLNDDCNLLQQYASKAYRGGYISCESIDVFNGQDTYDFDLINAYTIGMALLYDIDWDNPIAFHMKPNTEIDPIYFLLPNGDTNPMAPVFAKVKFEFSKDCHFPCLPYGKENGKGLIDCEFYPRSNDTGVYCCGPELYLAMNLGAKVTIIDGFVANVLKKPDGTISQSLLPVVKEYVSQRAEATKKYGKNSIEAAVLKKLVNSIYGKISQNVTAMYDESEASAKDIAESKITNNVFAAMITSLIRAAIIAALNNVEKLGYFSYSATTDGLITCMPYDEFEEMDLFELKPYLMGARRLLTGESSPKLWALKHQQNDLLNLSSTCNGSLIVEDESHIGGVIAHSGFSTTCPKKSLEGRKEFFEAAAERTGSIITKYEEFPNLDKVKSGAIFSPKIKSKTCSFDFDMKRKPLKETLSKKTIDINGKSFEIATLSTEPFEDVDEYLLYNNVKKNHKCLRTVEEWNKFFRDIELKSNGCSELPHTQDYDFRILCDVIKGYKKGLWDIPFLNQSKLSVSQKCEWIQSFNTSADREYTTKDWARASEKKRWSSILPYAVLKDIIEKMNKNLD